MNYKLAVSMMLSLLVASFSVLGMLKKENTINPFDLDWLDKNFKKLNKDDVESDTFNESGTFYKIIFKRDKDSEKQSFGEELKSLGCNPKIFPFEIWLETSSRESLLDAHLDNIFKLAVFIDNFNTRFGWNGCPQSIQETHSVEEIIALEFVNLFEKIYNRGSVLHRYDIWQYKHKNSILNMASDYDRLAHMIIDEFSSNLDFFLPTLEELFANQEI